METDILAQNSLAISYSGRQITSTNSSVACFRAYRCVVASYSPSHCDNLEFPREADMPARISEAIVLRTYPLKEADLVVSFLTRDQGKLRGVAKRARRPKGGFGASLERLTHGKVFYFQRETRELVNLDACELIHSHFGLHGDFTVSLALDFIAEVSEQFLPAAEVNERFFRLLLTVLEHLRESAQNVWRAVTYFSLWVVRLSGFLPALDVCLECGAWLDDPEQPQRAFFNRAATGLFCSACRRSDSWEISVESRAIAAEILRKPVAQVSGQWSKGTAADLRHFLVQRMEEAIERKLITAPVLEAS
jgi:DNA repair protein RecO (recombination protein O)